MTDHWIKRELLLLDLETDAAEPEEAYAIQAALIRIRPGQPRVDRKWLIQPRREISAEATGVHGIPTEEAKRDGRPIDEVLCEITLGLSAWSRDNVLVGHNIGYDLTVLDRECGRVLDWALPILGPVVDTLLLDKRCDRFRKGSRQLADQAKHYGLTLSDDDAHDAMADALVAGQLAYKLVARAKNNRWPRGRYGPHATEREARSLVATDDILRLHRFQARWHEEGQRGLAEYWRTPKAVVKTREKVARGEMTEEAAEAWIAELPAAADRVEAQAVGCWPVIPRVPIAT